jgi:NAD(P)-dependent dehydrogenase (short-subunit alcohol dehydrogenase family)
LGDPQDLVGAILFLASDESLWVTGSTVTVDGGYNAQ